VCGKGEVKEVIIEKKLPVDKSHQGRKKTSRQIEQKSEGRRKGSGRIRREE
jgi:hypothetical protein